MTVSLEVGQRLYFVPSHRGAQPREIVIEKVGRKWAISQGYRIDMGTLMADGGEYASPGRAYLSEAEYAAEKVLHAAWDTLRKLISNTYRVPDGVTISQIENATRSLFKSSPREENHDSK